MSSQDELLKQAQSLNQEKKYNEAVELLKDELLETFQSADLFAEKAEAYYRLDDKGLCEVNTKKALIIDPTHAKANNYQGILNLLQKDFDKAKECFEVAIKTAPKNAIAYNSLGSLYYLSKNYEKAKEFFKKAIELSPGYCVPYSNLGLVYNALKDYEKAIEFYNKAIAVSPTYAIPNNGLANLYYSLKNYEKAIASYSQYINLTKSNPDYNTKVAEEKVIELTKQIKNTDYSTISEVVDKVKTLLLFDDGYITHYTGMSVAKTLVLKDSLLRLSEGAFLNDTSEGGELFKCLPVLSVTETVDGEAVAKPFVQKPFIGSFVTDARHDDLTLWRMYGKENKEEARGCSVTIDGVGLIEDLKAKLSPENDKGTSAAFEDEFRFYRVAYISYSADKKESHFTIPDTEEGMGKKLTGHMEELHKAVEVFTKKYKDKEDIQDVLKKLNEIAYLFKSAAYQYEHEVRLIVNGTGFDKIINEDKTPPGVYIELVKITPRLKKITLGPKVDRAEEWAAAFYYSLDKQGLKPEILISHLPFK